ncbi:MAG: hypothetical protein MI974_03560 [Chitinophagales bacterium]|nr:hypothetical protein [Chitinophagales bacterium]
MKNELPLLLMLVLSIILLSVSCDKDIISNGANNSTASYNINGVLNQAQWTYSRAIFKNGAKDTINIYVTSGWEDNRHTISLAKIILKEGVQDLLGVFKVGSIERILPTPSLSISVDHGLDVIGKDWYYLDTTASDNWINILTYNETSNFIRGNFQFTAIRDTVFSPSGALPDMIVIEDGYFETTVD